MGSLMAGWNSPVHDPRTVKLERNKSLTKEEIESYWKLNKRYEGDHVKPVSYLATKNNQESMPEESQNNTSLEEFLKKTGWWTRTSSAFLNEPPVIAAEGLASKYASQFHVAGIAGSKPHSQTGIPT